MAFGGSTKANASAVGESPTVKESTSAELKKINVAVGTIGQTGIDFWVHT